MRQWFVLILLALPLPILAAPLPERDSGLVELSIWQAANGLSLGIETSVAQHIPTGPSAVISVLGLASGAVLPSQLTPKVTVGQAMLINAGTQMGVFNGLLVMRLTDGPLRDVPIGQLTGTLAGAVLARARPPEAGRIALAQSAALWLGVGTLVQGSRHDEPLNPAILTADAGWMLGYLLWPYMKVTRAQMAVFDVATAAGTLMGLLAGLEGHAEDRYTRALVGLGVGAGLAVGILAAVHDWRDKPTPVAWGIQPLAGGALVSVLGPW